MFSSLRARFVALLVVLAAALGFTVAAAAPANALSFATNASISTAVFNLINTERAANYLPPIYSDPRLRASAHAHNNAMATYNTLSHQLPGEPSFSQRITNAGFHWSYCGENVAWSGDLSQNGAFAVQAMMYNEKPPNIGHRINILSRTFTRVGVDVVIDTVHHKLWLTEDFARP